MPSFWIETLVSPLISDLRRLRFADFWKHRCKQATAAVAAVAVGRPRIDHPRRCNREDPPHHKPSFRLREMIYIGLLSVKGILFDFFPGPVIWNRDGSPLLYRIVYSNSPRAFTPEISLRANGFEFLVVHDLDNRAPRANGSDHSLLATHDFLAEFQHRVDS